MEKEIGKLEKHLAEKYDEEGFRKICQLKSDLHEIYNKKAEYSLFRLKTNFYQHGEKMGRLLARQRKRLDSNNTITAIRKDDKLFTSANKINEVFKDFYEDLYTSTSSAGDEDLNSFFQKVELPRYQFGKRYIRDVKFLSIIKNMHPYGIIPK